MNAVLWMVTVTSSPAAPGSPARDGSLGPADRAAVDEVLDGLHQAAADADLERYFGSFTDDAVFIGTDATERWELPAFRAFAEPHFAEAPAWHYTPVRRDVRFDDRGRTAWFDESLRHTTYGEVRGSGVLVRQGRDWRVAQYVLSFPIPNDTVPDVLAVVTHRDDRLPTPYTAEQLRAALVPGLTMTYRHADRVDGGEVVSIRRTTVVAADGERVTFGFQVDGADRGTHTSPFAELRDHASFPVRGTTWAEETVTVPFGTIPTRKYVVATDTGTQTYWFSPAHPGPPVRLVLEADGERVSEVVLLERTVDPAP